jgi:hypothetical protein
MKCNARFALSKIQCTGCLISHSLFSNGHNFFIPQSNFTLKYRNAVSQTMGKCKNAISPSSIPSSAMQALSTFFPTPNVSHDVTVTA